MEFNTSSQEEKTTVARTDVEIKALKERISMILVNLNIDNTINDEESCRKLINIELAKKTNYKIDDDNDVTEKGLKITNSEGTVLHATIMFDNTAKVDFNI